MRRIAIANCSSKFYNLGCEKISTYHTSIGNEVIRPEAHTLLEIRRGRPYKFDELWLSAIFSWDLPLLCQIANAWKNKCAIKIGGISPSYMHEYIKAQTGIESHIGKLGDEIDKIKIDNCQLTFSQRGCPFNCGFCVVWRYEKFEEYNDFQISNKFGDNNFLACSFNHRQNVYKKIKESNIKQVEWNQSLDADLFTQWDCNQMVSLNKIHIYRFAFDNMRKKDSIQNAIRMLKNKGIEDYRKIGIYMLYAFNDTPEDAFERLQILLGLSVMPFAMPYKQLTQLEFKPPESIYKYHWTDELYSHFARYCNRALPFSRLQWKWNDYTKKYCIKYHDVWKKFEWR